MQACGGLPFSIGGEDVRGGSSGTHAEREWGPMAWKELARFISHGGVVLAQDEASSAVWGMPGRVADSGIATAVLALDAMAREVNQRVFEGRVSEDRSLPRSR